MTYGERKQIWFDAIECGNMTRRERYLFHLGRLSIFRAMLAKIGPSPQDVPIQWREDIEGEIKRLEQWILNIR